MKRSAILIGVDRTAGLPALKDPAKGARRVEEWAHSQKIDSIKVFTDENGGSVEMDAVKRAIRSIVDAGGTHLDPFCHVVFKTKAPHVRGESAPAAEYRKTAR